MAAGFDATYPKGWFQRKFWAGPHKSCREDHMQRESCPFHDLRASGCFQPESWGPGVGGAVLTPADLCVRRGDGQRFVVNTSTSPGKAGCGGAPMLFDTDPGRPSQFHLRHYDARPWTTTKKVTDLFSRPPYKAVPPVAVLPPPVEPIFRTSKNVGGSYLAYAHMPDEYKKRVDCERPAFRLKAGKVPFRLDPRMKFEPGPDVKDTKKPKREIKRNVFVAYTPIQGTFSQYPSYIPQPFVTVKINNDRRPLRGAPCSQYKRQMPIEVPWAASSSRCESLPSGDLLTSMRAGLRSA